MNRIPNPVEQLDPDRDNGTMVENVETLASAVVGHRIVSAQNESFVNRYGGSGTAFVITLDNGRKVGLHDSGDCCAYTELESFLLHPEMVDHIIMGVDTTDGYSTWHIFADFGDVLELTVGWSCGNPFYYGYGFHINVVEVE